MANVTQLQRAELGFEARQRGPTVRTPNHPVPWGGASDPFIRLSAGVPMPGRGCGRSGVVGGQEDMVLTLGNSHNLSESQSPPPSPWSREYLTPRGLLLLLLHCITLHVNIPQ